MTYSVCTDPPPQSPQKKPTFPEGKGGLYTGFFWPYVVSFSIIYILLHSRSLSRRVTLEIKNGCEATRLGTLRSDDGDGGGENVKKAIGLITKTTILHVHHALLYIPLPSLHDYDLKMPNFTVYRGRTQATTKFPLSIRELGYGS